MLSIFNYNNSSLHKKKNVFEISSTSGIKTLKKNSMKPVEYLSGF